MSGEDHPYVKAMRSAMSPGHVVDPLLVGEWAGQESPEGAQELQHVADATPEQDAAQAASILSEAGWAPVPHWPQGYTFGPLVVGGRDPSGALHIKNIGLIGKDDPRYGADTPDTLAEAAAWLAARYVNPLSLASVGEAVQPVEHETHSETDAATPGEGGPECREEAGRTSDAHGSPESDDVPAVSPSQDLGGDGGDVHADPSPAESWPSDDDAGRADFVPVQPSPAELKAIAETEALFDDVATNTALSLGEDDASGAGPGIDELVVESPEKDVDETIDATFWSEDREALEAPDLGADIVAAEEEETPQDRFYGLDDLDRRRSLRIGDTMRYAKSIMPFWTTNEDAALAELRNFAMGVSEKRWPDDAGRQAELGYLETQARRIRTIERVRDEKVEFLEAASRDEVEAFVVEDGWP